MHCEVRDRCASQADDGIRNDMSRFDVRPRTDSRAEVSVVSHLTSPSLPSRCGAGGIVYGYDDVALGTDPQNSYSPSQWCHTSGQIAWG